MTGYRTARETFKALKGDVCMVCGHIAACWCGHCMTCCPDPKEHALIMKREGPVELKQPPQRVHSPLPKDNARVWANVIMGKSLD